MPILRIVQLHIQCILSFETYEALCRLMSAFEPKITIFGKMLRVLLLLPLLSAAASPSGFPPTPPYYQLVGTPMSAVLTAPRQLGHMLPATY